MAVRAPNKNEIYIHGNFYRTQDDIRMFPVSRQPPKLITGEVQDQSNPISSTWTIDDMRGGIGVLISDVDLSGSGGPDNNRCWWSTCSLRYKGHIVPQRLTTTTAAFTTPDDVDVLADFKNEIYATVGTAIHVYDNTTDSWGASVRTLLNDATDWARGLVGGTDTLVIATGSEVDYATDSSTWARNTTDIKFVEFWNDLLWGIDNTGQLYYTDDLSSAWTADARLQLPDGYVEGLLVARGADREQHIYAATNVGLYIHDSINSKFLPTDLQLPFHPDAGKGATVFRGNVLFSAGNAVYLFQAGADQTVVTIVGPDRRDGLPSDKRGSISKLLASHNDLLAFLDATGAVGVSNVGTRGSAGAGSSRKSVFGASVGFSLILGWDEQGWEVKWLSGSNTKAVTAGVVSNAYSTYRTWWAQNQRVYYQQLPVDIVNPTQITGTDFETGAVLETSWFDAGVSNQGKLALSLFVDSSHPTTSETLELEYATNLNESYTTIATKSTDGQTEYMLPSSSDVTGVAFRYFKFRVTWARGATTTNFADLHKMFLVYRKKANTLWGVAARLDLTKPYNGVPPNQQLKNLNTAMNSDTLIQVTWRDDDTGDQNYFMDMRDMQTTETSGNVPIGAVDVFCAEPRQSTSR